MLTNGVAVLAPLVAGGVLAAAAVATASCVSIPALASDGGADATIEAGKDAALEAGADAPVDAAIDGPAVVDAGDGSIPCPGTYAQAIEKLPGLVAYWRLDEDAGTIAHDQTGRHDGVYGSGVVLGQAGLLAGDPDTAISVDGGVGGYVDIPTEDGGLDLSVFTLGAMLRPTAIGDAGQQIVARTLSYWLQLMPPENGGSVPGLEIGFVSPDADNHQAAVSPSLGVDVTSHVVGTYDGASFVFYADGKPYATDTQTGSADFPPNHLYIGSWDGTSFMQVGVLDDVFIYNRALSASEVLGLYQAAQGCAYGLDP